jgi:hypothetical protein
MSPDSESVSNNDSTEIKASPSEHIEAPSEPNENYLKETWTATTEDDPNCLRVVHTDGTVNYVDNKAVGGDAAGMPKGYFKSPQFIGTVVVSIPKFNLCI